MLSSSSPGRWWHTGRHVPARQLSHWLVRRLFPPRPPELRTDVPPRRSTAFTELAGAARALEPACSAERLARARSILDGRFCFLNAERRLSKVDWTAQYGSPLWTYHLHYFDFAVDLARAYEVTGEREFQDRYVQLWSSWIDAAAAGSARLEPYPTSVRCMNALRSLWLLAGHDGLPDGFVDRLLAATHVQLDWLGGNLERHLRANHLQKNLTALAWGSLAFGGEAADGWEPFRVELWEEIREQVLADGGHFERSPMYHAHALDDLLRTLALCRAAGVPTPDDVPGRLAAMTRALQWLSRPDGTLHLFNDAANGQGASRDDLLALARRVLESEFPAPEGSFALPDTGYFGHVDADAGHRLVVDAGPPGPDYQPGHAHCDMLSFELDLAGRPVVVDAGVHGYDGDPYREYVRSTRAHNTVSIDGLDQHEMWATFRVARRGEIVEARPDEPSGQGVYTFRGACRPYHDRTAVHHRLVELSKEELIVTDRVSGAAGHPVASWLHLHPEFRVVVPEEGRPGDGDDFVAIAEDPPMRIRIVAFGGDDVTIHHAECDPVQSWHCPEFGLALPATAIQLRFRSNDGRAFGWRMSCL